jgi:hypothetical protein
MEGPPISSDILPRPDMESYYKTPIHIGQTKPAMEGFFTKPQQKHWIQEHSIRYQNIMQGEGFLIYLSFLWIFYIFPPF